MDVKFVFCYFLTVCCLDLTDADSKVPTSDGVLTTSSDAGKQCETKLYSCAIKMGQVDDMGPKGLNGELGIKGDKGEIGPKGDPGAKGDAGFPGNFGLKGLQGERGYKGEVGSKGEKGEMGIKGDIGTVGPQGTKGDAGEKGKQGEPGHKGDNSLVGPQGVPGIKGTNGDKGEVGPPGIPGLPGSCRCLNGDETETRTSDPPPAHLPSGDSAFDEDIDETSDPLEETEDKILISCKHASKKSKSGKYWVRKSDPFEVSCDMERNMTCILIDDSRDFIIEKESVGYGNEGTFWLSEKGFALTDFYKSVTIEQIEWLQRQSFFITQTIRYHCKNSYIYRGGESSMETALRLLSWKETVIAPKPTENTPFFYSISPEADECKDSGDFKTEWKHTDIKVISTTKGLPVIDFHIRDIRNEDQWVYVQLKELCFG